MVCAIDVIITLFLEFLIKSNIIPALVLPLAGGEEVDDDDTDKMYEELQYLPEDKKREADPNIRLLLVESLKLLCQSRVGREEMRDKRVVCIWCMYCDN